MNNIKVLSSGTYLPKTKVTNNQLEKRFNVDEDYIYKRTGIRTRYYSDNETIEELAINAVKDLFTKVEQVEEIGLIITATTSSDNLMPGISNSIQKKFGFKKSICLDVVGGCAGYINALDIAYMYIKLGKVKNALVIGADILSKYTNKDDIDTAIVLADGAGALLIGKIDEEKQYFSNIESIGNNNEILTCNVNDKIKMMGKQVYKYATTKPVINIEELLEKANENVNNIKYIIPHQSNIRIIKSISKKLGLSNEKVYTNIENVGNTFCASIPIAFNEMLDNKLLQNGDKIILLGYGGGLNTGSVLIEV